MKRKKISNRTMTVAAACCGVTVAAGMATLALAQERRYTIDDILGTPGKKTVSNAQPRVDRANKQAAVVAGKRRDDEARVRQASLASLAVAAGAAGADAITPRIPAPAGGPPLQNYVLSFVNPRRAPVANLAVTAVVYRQSANGRAATPLPPLRLTTDAQGRVRLARIGPLPVVVSLALDSPAAADPAEWRFSDAHSVSLTIARPLGARIGTVAFVPPSGRPRAVQVASLGGGAFGAAPPPRPSGQQRRTVLYEYRRPDPLIVERGAVDVDIVGAPPGSRVTTPVLGGRTLEVPASGRLTCRLPLAPLAGGPVPIRIARDLPAGEAETLVSAYPTDPYAPAGNEARSPEMRLVRLTKWRAAGGVNVMDTREDVIRALGDASKSRGSVNRMPDGSEWWLYPQRGVFVKMRSSPFDKTFVVERVRVVGPEGGDAGGVSVNGSLAVLRQMLGAPQIANDAQRVAGDVLRPSEAVDSYLDRGLRVCHDGDKIVWMEVARPRQLLAEGTSAFVPGEPAALFVEGFGGAPAAGEAGTAPVLLNMTDFRGYLKRLPAVRLVASRNEADLILSGGVSATVPAKAPRNASADAGSPSSARIATQITYSLFDTRKNEFVVKPKTAPAKSLAIMNDLNRVTDFAVRVVEIDYARGLLRLNQGADAGLWASLADQSCEFQIFVGNVPLPFRTEGKDGGAPLYKAVVVQADAGSAVCELRAVRRGASGAGSGLARFEPKAALDVIRQIPDPATGLVSARFSLLVPFLRRAAAD